MQTISRPIISVVTLAAMACGVSQAFALTGGGTAPGGPLSGSIRSACNGYNMDGTVNTSAGADHAGCIDRSANAIHRPVAAQQPRD